MFLDFKRSKILSYAHDKKKEKLVGSFSVFIYRNANSQVIAKWDLMNFGDEVHVYQT